MAQTVLIQQDPGLRKWYLHLQIFQAAENPKDLIVLSLVSLKKKAYSETLLFYISVSKASDPNGWTTWQICSTKTMPFGPLFLMFPGFSSAGLNTLSNTQVSSAQLHQDSDSLTPETAG